MLDNNDFAWGSHSGAAREFLARFPRVQALGSDVALGISR